MNDLKKDILSLIEKYNDSKDESVFIPGESQFQFLVEFMTIPTYQC